MKLQLNPDWTEFLSVLISRRVKFVLIGGHAVAAWAEPRMTEDLDVLVAVSRTNAQRLRSALVDFGFGAVLPKSSSAFLEEGKIWMLGRKPNRVDILTAIDGVTFDAVWRGRVRVDFDAGELFLIGREQLLANKRAAGRPKELADAAAIEKYAPPTPDKRRAPTSKRAIKRPR
jgi:hypothetical protein